jgi:hypothetical protein
MASNKTAQAMAQASAGLFLSLRRSPPGLRLPAIPDQQHLSGSLTEFLLMTKEEGRDGAGPHKCSRATTAFS